MCKARSLLLIQILFIMTKLTCAEYKNTKWPSIQFNEDNEFSYRIEGDLPNLGIMKINDSGIGIFPLNNQGVYISSIEGLKYKEWTSIKWYARVTIIPTIVFTNEKTKFLLEPKDGDIFWEDYEIFKANCLAYRLKLFDKGISVLVDDHSSESRFTEIFLRLKEDGKYYEIKSEQELGNLKQVYEAFNESTYEEYYDFAFTVRYPGFVFFKINKNEKKVEDIILQGMKFFNKTDDGVEFITPYGAGFYSFETKEINLVNSNAYIGKTFSYLEYKMFGWWHYGKIMKKVITQDDFNFVPGGF